MISIVIPAHNGSEYLESALASVEAQDFQDREIVLVDDASTEALHPPEGVRYFRLTQRSGPSAARNRGIRESRGELIAFLDIDDLWAAGHLSRLSSALAANPAAGIAQGRMRQLFGNRISGPYRMPYAGSCLFRREVLERCGGFDETMTLGEDYDLMVRCWEKDIEKITVDEVSLIYRRHGKNTTQGNHTLAHVIVVKRRMERIRAGTIQAHEPRRFRFQEYIGDTGEASAWTLWSAS
jgi:glycosyltransferase involved in cell wall biosynthesis